MSDVSPGVRAFDPVLVPLAVVVRPLTRTAWARLLRTSKVERNGQGVTPNDLRHLAPEWVSKGVLVADKQERYALAASARHSILEKLQSEGRLHPALRAWRSAVNPYGYNKNSQDGDLHLSDAWVHLYSAAPERLGASIAAYERVPTYSEVDWGVGLRTGAFGVRPTGLVELLGLTPHAGALALLPASLLRHYLGELSNVALCALTAVPESVVAQSYQEGISCETIARFAVSAAFRGQREMLNSLWSRIDVNRAVPLASRAVVELVRGDAAAARRWAREACLIVGGRRGDQWEWLCSPLCPWVGLLLCTSQEIEDLSLGSALLQLVEGQKKRLPAGASYAILREFRRTIDSGQSDPVAFRAIVEEHGGLANSAWWEGLFLALCLRWLQPSGSTAVRMPVDLDPLRWFAERDGFFWVAEQLGCAVSHDGRSSRLGGGSGALGPKGQPLPGFFPLAELYQPRPAWESALGTLERLLTPNCNGAAGESKAETEQRLIWVLTPGTAPVLEARLQSRGKRGFSRGKKLGTGKLAQIRDGAMPYLDNADREVLRHVHRYREHGMERHYVAADAVSALCGHPRVELASNPGSFVQVQARPPKLLVERQGQAGAGTLRVALSPVECVEGDPIVEETTEGAVVVYQLDPTLGDVARALAKGLCVPAAGERRLTDLLGTLSRKFDVHSDVVGTGLEQVQADCRIHVRLWRGASGVRARLGVQPLAELDRWYTPGKGQGTVVCEVAGKSCQVIRDLPAEQCLAEQVFDSCPALQLAERESEDYVVRDIAGSLELLVQLQALERVAVIHWPEGAPLTVSAERTVQDLTLRVGSAGDLLTLDGSVKVSRELTLKMSDLLARVSEAKGRFVPLGDDQFLALEQGLLQRLAQLERVSAARGKKTAGSTTRLSMALAEVVGALAEQSGKVKVGAKAQQALSRVGEARDRAFPVPSELRAELRDYQVKGYEWLSRLAHWGAGACLADDMGLGKTLQILTLLLARAEQGPALVVAPTSVCPTWISEARRFVPDLKTIRLRSNEVKKQLDSLSPADVLICSYGVMQNQIELIESVDFATVVLDEAQAIKNVAARRTKASLRLQARFRVATTGTPIENRLGELWSLQNFLNPGLLGSEKQFEKRFSGPIENEADNATAEMLRRLIEPFLLRRTKAQVLTELPSKTEMLLSVELSGEERAFYEAIRQKALHQLEAKDQGATKRFAVLAELTRLRRAVCNPNLVAKNSGVKSSKFEAVQALVSELRAGGHRALVFSQFVDHLDQIRVWLRQEDISHQYLVGATPEAQREAAVNAFQEGKGDLFLISLKAGGFGLNLTSADYVLILDPWWNPAAEDQAADRAHRMGQQRPVTVYRLVARDTIEEKIVELHKKKRNLADSLLAGMSNSGALDLEAMRGLLMQSAGVG